MQSLPFRCSSRADICILLSQYCKVVGLNIAWQKFAMLVHLSLRNAMKEIIVIIAAYFLLTVPAVATSNDTVDSKITQRFYRTLGLAVIPRLASFAVYSTQAQDFCEAVEDPDFVRPDITYVKGQCSLVDALSLPVPKEGGKVVMDWRSGTAYETLSLAFPLALLMIEAHHMQIWQEMWNRGHVPNWQTVAFFLPQALLFLVIYNDYTQNKLMCLEPEQSWLSCDTFISAQHLNHAIDGNPFFKSLDVLVKSFVIPRGMLIEHWYNKAKQRAGERNSNHDIQLLNDIL